MSQRRSILLAASLIFILLPARPGDAAAGELTQYADPNGCLVETGDGVTCVDGNQLSGPFGIAVSPDGGTVYVVSQVSDSLVTLSRSTSLATYGHLFQAACYTKLATGGCTTVPILDNPRSVAVSPDGTSVYVVSNLSDSIAVFDRGTSGALTLKAGTTGCVSDDGSAAACVDSAAPMDAPLSVAVSPDNTSVYVTAAAGSDDVVVFDRDVSGTSTHGTLTQKTGTAGCVKDNGGSGCATGTALNGAIGIATSHDGRSVYVTAFTAHGLVVFDRDTSGTSTNGTLTQKSGKAGCLSSDAIFTSCKIVRGLGAGTEAPNGVVVSPDGSSVYAVSGDGAQGSIAEFVRDPATGKIKQDAGTSGCVNDNGADGCSNGKALLGANTLAVGPEAKTVYVTGYNSSSLVTLDRDPSTGALKQRSGAAGCIVDGANPIGCAVATTLAAPLGVAVAPTGGSIYVTSQTDNGVAAFSRKASFINCAFSLPTMQGGAGDEVLDGTGYDDVISGGKGKDIISGFAGNDLLCGDTQNDKIFGGDGKDLLDGGDGSDKCDGGNDNDKAKHCETITTVP